MSFLRLHLKRVVISAGIASVAWNFILLSGSGLWQTWSMVGITFLSLGAFMYFVIGALSLLGRTQARSDAKVREAAAVALSDGFSFDPTKSDWATADKLYRDALAIEPTNTLAAHAHYRFLRDTIEVGYMRFDADEIEALPIEYRRLPETSPSGFVWAGFGRGFADWPERPDSFAGRVRRSLVSSIGGVEDTKPNWIVGLIAVFLLVAPCSVEERANVESALASRYRSVCESVLGDCGGKINGFDKVDAFDAAKAVLGNRYPVHTASGYRDIGISCWDYAEDDETVVWARTDRGHFELSFGERQGAGRGPNADTWVEETSRWLVTPPASDGAWTVTVDKEPIYLDRDYTCAN